MHETPVTFGQKSVLWAERHFRHDAHRDALVTRVNWAIPASVTEAAVREGLACLVRRHEALRTTFHDLSGPEPVQVLTGQADLDPPPSLLPIREGQPCWGAQIAHGPAGSRLELRMHRVIADEASVNLFMTELNTLIACGPVPECPSPRELALVQRSPSWRKRRSAAERYWESIIDQVRDTGQQAAPPAAGTAVVAFATIPARDHRLIETAGESGLSPGGYLVMVLARLLLAGSDRDRATIMVQFANRSEPRLHLMMANQSQAVPLVFRGEEARGATAGDLAEMTRWKLVHAQRHGMHDPEVPRTLGWDDLPERHLVNYTEGGHADWPHTDRIRRGVFSRPHPAVIGGVVVSVKNRGGHLSLGLRGDAAGWERPTMSRMLGQFIAALSGLPAGLPSEGC